MAFDKLSCYIGFLARILVMKILIIFALRFFYNIKYAEMYEEQYFDLTSFCNLA